MKRIFDDPVDAKRAYREMYLLRHLRHPCVVSLHDVVSTTITSSFLDPFCLSPLPSGSLGNLYLVLEFVDTDLSKILRSQQYLSEEHIAYLFYQLLDGLAYLHDNKVIHRDLKPANLLVNCRDCTIKIADFGLARIVSDDDLLGGMPSARLSPDHSSASHHSCGSEGESEDVRPCSCMADLSLDPSLPAPSCNSERSTLPPPVPLRRGLTRHVVTRWYRAPEVILLQPYSAAVDLWSAACIFAELLGLIQANVADFRDRKALFPGESCGELSAEDLRGYTNHGPDSASSGEVETRRPFPSSQAFLRDSYYNKQSQLNVILEVLGSPSDEDLATFEDNVASTLRALPRRPAKNLATLFPAAAKSTLDLLGGLLRFNPKNRTTAREALNARYFDHVKTLPYFQNYRASSHAAAQLPGISMEVEKASEAGHGLRRQVAFLCVSFPRSRY